MKRLCVIGAGYVGLTTGICLADLGNEVTCVEIDPTKVRLLLDGKLPIFEPGLEEMLRRNARAGRLRFTNDYAQAVPGAEFAFIAVATPTMAGGDAADLDYVRIAAETLANHLSGHTIIINKSTVPIGTGDWVADIVSRHRARGASFSVVSNPEFLREGSAVHDFLVPDRVVLGSTNRDAAEAVASLYLSLKCPIIITDLRTAEMIKYASNAFLATRISFINEMSHICERLGADIKQVAVGMGYDKRIGHAFLDAGLGFGGSCFPKDVRALAHMADTGGCHPQLLRAVLEINHDQRIRIARRIVEVAGEGQDRQVGLLGLAFKPNTDDMREAPVLDIARLLLAEGITVRAYDPAAMEQASVLLPDVRCCTDPYSLASGADALVLITDWNEFKQLDMDRIARSMRHAVFVDGRNMYDAEVMQGAGFDYVGIGRGNLENPSRSAALLTAV
jgi:UDPglucose 6-dehydrogenase